MAAICALRTSTAASSHGRNPPIAVIPKICRQTREVAPPMENGVEFPHSTAGDLREANRSGRGPEKIREARSGLLRFCLQPSDVVRQRVAAVGSNKVVHGQLLRAAHDGEGRVRVGVGYEAIIGGVGDAVAVDD